MQHQNIQSYEMIIEEQNICLNIEVPKQNRVVAALSSISKIKNILLFYKVSNLQGIYYCEIKVLITVLVVKIYCISEQHKNAFTCISMDEIVSRISSVML